MKILSVLGSIVSLLCLSSANAYTLTEKFVTDHYGVYEAVLSNTEVYNDSLEQIMVKDMFSRGKLQTTTVVFKYHTQGLKGTIKEPVESIITTQQYNAKAPTSRIDRKAKYATYGGIYVTQKQLSEMANNRTMQSYVLELANMPLIISDLNVDSLTVNFENKAFVTSSLKGFTLDLQIIDSLFYTQKEIRKLNDKCKISVLAFTDRKTDNYPFFFAGHGALNDIKCTNKK